MKKIFYSLALVSLIFAGFSCSKPNNGNRTDTIDDKNNDGVPDDKTDDNTPEEPEKPTVKTAAENLVLHISFDTDNLIEVGEGVTFKESKGQAGIATGFIGKGWTNKAKNNTSEAYSKFDVASDNLFKKLESVTFTAWVNNNKDFYKGGVISLNGGRNGDAPHDFPAFNVYLDNNNPVTIEDAQVPAQQVNGRMIFHDDNGAEQNLWLDTNDPAFAIYGNWFQLAFTYELNTTKPADPEDPDAGTKT